jgi:aldose 1-epimerase
VSLLDFGTLPDGSRIHALDLHNDRMTLRILTLGAILNDLRLAGMRHSLCLGYDTLDPYLDDMGYCGAVVGPVANRLRGARAPIDGTIWQFPANEGAQILHGGEPGLHGRIWDVVHHDPQRVILRCVIPHLADSFPGNRVFTADYTLTGAILRLDLQAKTDQPTLVNLAPHTYWNLTGGRDLTGHDLQVAADHVLPIDAEICPAGPPEPVQGGFDLRSPHPLMQTRFDHCFCLTGARGPMRRAAVLQAGGIRMVLTTTEPGLQVYDGHAHPTRPFFGVALESQCWPDAPNQPHFPPIRLGPEDGIQTQTTEWSFDHVD